MQSSKQIIAQKVALMLKDGDYVNLGIGTPTLVCNYLPEGVHIILQAENGMLLVGKAADKEDKSTDYAIHDAGGNPVLPLPGSSYFDSSMSFAMIRGGHMDVTVMGAMEVDEEGSLANYTVPGKLVAGMGGAMDLCSGAKKIIIAMEHCAKDGSPKVRSKCTLPLTGYKCVNLIVTQYATLQVTPKGLQVLEIDPQMTPEALQAITEAKLLF